VKALRQRKVSLFTDNRSWDDRSLAPSRAVNSFCRQRGRC
jgi:hypothetical protein